MRARDAMGAGKRQNALVALALAAVCLAGCASTDTSPSPSKGVGRAWAFQAANRDEPAKLAYGQPNTDDVDLLLWCRASQHAVQLTAGGDDQHPFSRITLQSGPQGLKLSLTQDSRLGPAGQAPLDSRLLAGFRATGRLRMSLDGGMWTELNARTPDERRQIQNFFAVCQ